MLPNSSGFPMVAAAMAGFVGVALIRRFRSWIELAYHTLGRDLAFVVGMGRVFGRLMLMQRRGVTIPALFREQGRYLFNCFCMI